MIRKHLGLLATLTIPCVGVLLKNHFFRFKTPSLEQGVIKENYIKKTHMSYISFLILPSKQTEAY